MPDRTPPADATTAPPSVQAPPAPVQAAPAPGASSARAAHDPLTWQGALLAQLEKFKRYPPPQWARGRKACPSSGSPWTAGACHLGRTGQQFRPFHAGPGSRGAAPPRPAAARPARQRAGDPITLTVPVEFYLHQN
ncbi:hypothetical protein RAA17_18610 [Komagataeibacter rhaeticus]|nr:hypothetical protein [Komagataeibacter rhaeticus]